MVVRVVDYQDGVPELLTLRDGFTHPSLSFGATMTSPELNAPQVVFFQGLASATVYLEALKSLRYSNLKGRPTSGSRIVTVTVYDGRTTNQITMGSYTRLTVSIDNTAPLLNVNGDEESYFNRFFPFKGPVSAVDPSDASIIDTDSPAIERATLQLHNVRNEQLEILSITYVSPERVSPPVIAEARDLEIPFGVLWRGERVPTITSTIPVIQSGTVGDVDVVVDIRHSWIGDLKIELEHMGRREVLVLSPGGQVCRRDDLFRTTFDSDSSSNVYLSKSTLSPGECQFQSQGLFTPDGDLSSFRGDPIQGDWKLTVTDLLLENDNGRLVSWSLVIHPEETHALVYYPPVVPPLVVSQQHGNYERHVKSIESDGRIADISVSVHLGLAFNAIQLYLPTMTLVHPDGTQVVLTDSDIPFCAIGNFTYLIFNDRASAIDYSCAGLLERRNQPSGSGSGSGSTLFSGLGMETESENGTTAPPPQETTTAQNGNGNSGLMSGFGSTMGSGSGSAMGILPDMYMGPYYDDIIDMNISIPLKRSLVDLLNPSQPLSGLHGKLVRGNWTLILSTSHELESTLLGWSLRIAREPNIDASYDAIANTLTLMGADSAENYEKVLRSVVYENIAPEPNFSIQRFIETVVYDGEAYSNVSLPAAQSNITVHHIDIDLDPVNITDALAPGFQVTFQEHSDPTPILDAENAVLRDEAFEVGEYTLTATLKGYQNFDEEGILYNISVAPNLQAVVVNDTGTQEYTVTVSSAVAELQPITSFEAVLRTFKYYNDAEEFVGNYRRVEIVAIDNQIVDQTRSFFVSYVAMVNVTFRATNDLPVLLLNSYLFDQSDELSNIVTYTEGQGPLLLANSSAVVLTDNDHNFLESITVTIQNPQDGLNETLSANTSGTAISAEYDNSTFTLLLRGTDTLENYITVIGTVAYENSVHSPGMPGTEPRRITFVPFDGRHQGLPVTSLVTFTSVNDPAIGDLNGPEEGTTFNTSFTEELGPTSIIDSDATLYDVDDTNLAFIDVTILNVFDGSLEVLSVMDITERTNPELKTVVLTNLRPTTTYTYDQGSTTLRISSLDSIREYQEVLKTLTYNNLADEPNPTTRMIQVVLSDSHSLSDPLNVSVQIQLINDSPFFDASVPPFQPQISEDLPPETNSGVTILEISYLISDDDVDAMKGIAIVGFDSENGMWEYTTNGNDWIPIPTNVSVSYALALESSPENGLRFIPKKDYNGIVWINIIAWDGTDGSNSGEFISAQSRSNTDAFSNETLTIQLIVVPVNDAPVLQETPIYLTTILEDDQNSTGDSVLSLLQYAYDVDIPTQMGVAITGADQENGTWQFTSDGGVTWEEFDDVNETAALLLQSIPEHLHRVRFVPDTNFNGQVSFQFLAWDLTLLPEDIPIPTPVEGSASGSTQSGDVVIEFGSSSGNDLSSGSGFFSEMPTAAEPSVNVSEPTPPPPYRTGTRYVNTTLSDPVTGPFSINSTSALLNVEPVNDSPVITPGMSLMSIYENTMVEMNHGTEVARIIRGFYSDVDVDPDMGLAVVEVDDRYGEWQYTCESPMLGNWMTFIGGMYYGEIIPRLPLPERATLLLSSCWIRFLPQPFFNTELDTDGYPRPPTDVPYITVHGWDNTGLTAGRNGTYGNDATYAADSDTNEFSSNSERVTIGVISINNVPMLYLTDPTQAGFSNTYVEDGPPVPAVGNELTLIDNDHARLRDVTITIYGSVFDQSPFYDVDFGSTFSGDFIYNNSPNVGILSGSGLSGSASSSGSGTSASGSGSGSSLGIEVNETTDSPPIRYVPVISSAPRLPPLHRIVEYVENLTSPSYLDRYCAGLEERREELLLDTSNLDVRSEVLSWCPYVVRIFADHAIAFDAYVEQFQLALRTLHYNNSLEEPEDGVRTLTFVVSDNVGLSSPVNSSIFVENVNDSPQFDLNDHIVDVNNFVSYTEGQGPLILSNDSALRLIDHDNDTLQGARIVLVEAPDADYEVLAANVTGTNIEAFYDNSTYTLTLSGNDTLEAYALVLETVTYTNLYANPGNPDERERQVHFFVSDGNSESYVAIAYISFTGVNNRPHMDVNGAARGVNYSATFVEEMGAVRIVDPELLIHDEDNTSLAYVTVQILDPVDYTKEFLEVNEVMLKTVLERNSYNREKVIQITNLVPNMTYDVMNSELTIRGLDSVEEYMLVLRTVMYNNIEDEPELVCRTIEFIANDWDLDSDPVYTTLCIDPFNDSPRFNTSVPEVFSPLILEDEVDAIGVPVFTFAYELIEDDDVPPPRTSIAIVSADMENGRWYFRTNGSLDWRPIRQDISFTNALLLHAELEAEDFVRFVPNRDFNGNASISFVAWDGSEGMSSGGHRSAISRNQTDPFSEDTRTMVLRIVPVNDAPVVNASIQPTMTPILEDDVRERESLGDDVVIFLESLSGDVDVPDLREHEFGIAVVGADSGNGYWQFSVDGGANWTNISIPITPVNAVLLRSKPEGWNRIRFVPDPDFNGMTSLQYKIWDQNVTYSSGTVGINTNIDPDATFSTSVTTALLTVEPVNDSPVLLGDTTLTPIREDQNPSVNLGTLVDEILRGVAVDIDSAEVAIAVLYVDRRNGDWQYTCDQGSRLEWQSFFGERLSFNSMFGSISQVAPLHPNEFRATLLAGSCRIRFLPNEDFNSEYNLDGSRRSPDDTPFISIRAWDRTSGSNRDVGVDTTSVPDDHTNAFSREIVNATVAVASLNDNPVLMLNGNFPDYPAKFVEPVPPERQVIPVPIVSQTGLSLTDADNASLTFVSVTFLAYDNTSESLLVNVSGTSLNYSIELEDFASVEEYSLRIAPVTGTSAPIGEFESVLRTLQYQNTAEEPDPTARFISFTVGDGLGFNSHPPQTELVIQLVNDPPQLDLGMNWPDSYAFVSYREGEGDRYIVSENTTLVDFDNTTLESARVVIMSPPDMHHELLNASAGSANITIVSASNGSELLLLGPASVEEFLEVIQSVTYTNTFSDPGDPSSMSRTIQFTVSDGQDESIPAFVYLSFAAINNRPFLDVNGPQPGVNFTAVFQEERGPVSVVSPATVIEDIDNTSLAYIEVRILNALDGDLEILFVEDVTETSAPLDSKHVTFWNYRPQQSYNYNTLTITGLDSIYEYQEVLKTLKYDNLADEPNAETRLVHFTVSDGLLTRTHVYTHVMIENINDSPFFNVSAPLFAPVIDEDVDNLLNPGWSVEELVGNQLILDDDANSLQGIAIVELDTENGHWEVTWDYTTEPPVFSGSGSSSGSGDLYPDSSGDSPTSDSLQPASSGLGLPSGDGNSTGSGDVSGGSASGLTSEILSGIGSAFSGIGSGIMGSGFGSGIETPMPPTTGPPPPKCSEIVPPTIPPLQPTFYATWYRLSPNTSVSMATVLRSHGNRTRVRFVPYQHFNGEASFRFAAWDVSNALDDGAVVNATSSSSTDPYSSDTVTITVQVDPVNDAPLLTNLTFNLTQIAEDDVDSFGDDVGDLLEGVSDIDISDSVFGVAIVLADEENGEWQFTTDGGTTWTTMSDVCLYNATVLSSQPYGEIRIRFVPYRDFNGYASFSFKAWDLTSGETSGTTGIDTTQSHPVIGAYSTTYTSASIFVEPVNDSPVLTLGSHLNTILEDIPAIENSGTLVADIVDGFYIDVDVNSQTGIAVVGVDLRYGVWEWRCPESAFWNEFIGDIIYGVIVPPLPLPEKATILGGDCLIRFLPNLNFNTLRDTSGDLRPLSDLPYLDVRGWDNTGISRGSSGQYGVDTTYSNDSITNEFSSETVKVIVEVTSVNDLAVIRIAARGDGLNYTTEYTEEQPYVRIVEPESVSLVDEDHSRLASLSIVLTNTLDPHSELLSLEIPPDVTDITLDTVTNVAAVTIDNFTEYLQIITHVYDGSADSAPSSLTFVNRPGTGRVSLEAYEALLKFVTYRNHNPEPNNETRMIQFFVDDSEQVNSMALTSVQVLLLNDNPPVLTNHLTYLDFIEGEEGPVSIVSDNLTLTDSDHNEYFFMTNATLQIYPTPVSPAENISVNTEIIAAEFNVIQSYDPSTGTLSILGDATVTNYEALLRTAVYQNTIEEPLPGIRTITMQVYDGDNLSNVQRVRVNVIAVNDRAPNVDTAAIPFVFTERTQPVAISDGLLISDQDSGGFPIVNVTFEITNPLDGDMEMLNVTEYGSITAQFQDSVLLLSGPASVGEFQRTIATLTYNNLAEEPNSATRIIAVLANDGNFDSEVEYIRVAIELVNDIPVVSFPIRETMVNYVEGIGPLPVASNITVTDNDHTNLLQFTVMITNPLDMPNEVLNISLSEDINITSSYNAEEGLLSLSGNASLEDYQAALRTLTYVNTEANPGFPDTDPRMIEFVAFDGQNYSTPVQILLTFESVNDAPIFDLNGAEEGTNFTTSFTEEDGPVMLTAPDAVLFDIDNTSLAYVRISITNLLDGSNEILSVSSNLSDMFDLAFISYDPDSGVLMVAGLDATENFEAAISSVTYNNVADEPDYTTRVVSFVASDGLLESRTFYTNVEMIPVNDPPRLTIAGAGRTSPPPLTPVPPTTDMPTMTTEPPPSSASGMGSGDIQTASGSGSGSGMGSSPSGSGIGLTSGSGDLMMGSGSGSGIDFNQTDMLTVVPPTQGPTVDPMEMFENVTLESEANFATFYAENSIPIPIVDIDGVLVEDDDHATLVRLEVVVDGVRDPGFEGIFFDSDALSIELIQSLARAAPGMVGYLGDEMSCVPGSGAVLHTEIDLEITLGILDWERVIRSLRYCNSDERPVNGTRTITFRIQDPAFAWSENQTATVEVFAINDAPICDTSVNLFTIDEDFNITIPVFSNCFDHEETLSGSSILIFSQPTLGQVVVNPDNGDITFQPAEHDYGTRTFAYQACDSHGACSVPQLITIVVNPVNDPPYARDNLTLVVQEDTTVVVQLSELYFFDVEDDLIPNNNFPRIVNATGSSGGNWFLTGEGPNATFQYTPFLNFVGRDQLIIDVCDSDNACVQITIGIVVESVNDLPVIEVRYLGGAGPAVTREDTQVSVEILVIDVEDRAPVQVEIISVGNGTASPDTSDISLSLEPITDRQLQTMSIIYTPDLNFYGDDSVTFVAIDSNEGTTEAVINVRVTYVNDPPEFGLTNFTIVEDDVTVWRLPLDLDITDPEDTLNAGSFSIVQQPQLGRVVYRFDEALYNSTGTFPAYGELVYHPPEHYFTSENETVDFVIRACDNDTFGDILCSNATIRVTILSDNDAPHLPRVPLTLYEDRIGVLYLWNFTYDVEEGRPPIANVSLIEPLPQKGVAEYNTTTGYLTYTPSQDVVGTDYVYYNACDSQNHCSQLRGEIVVTILPVNDQPMAFDFLHIAREDDFDLIGFFDNITDVENSNLRIEIVDPNDGSYMDEWTTAIGGRLRVYHAHQVITYLPPPDYVGPDSFMYAVCDSCDRRRDRELGRVTPDPECERQIEENGNSVLQPGSGRVLITCAEAYVNIVVANINDVPVARNLSGSTASGVPITFTPLDNSTVTSDLPPREGTGTYFYRNASSFIYDADDQQTYVGLRDGLNLTLYNLNTETDINETSVTINREPMTGAVELMLIDGRTRFMYTPNSNSSGYDFFLYEICDKLRAGESSPRCSAATVSVFVSRRGPEIVSIAASGAVSSVDPTQDSDSKVSRDDTLTITFSEATNMPPYRATREILTTNDVDMIFVFDEPHFLDAITKIPYLGQWITPTVFELKFVDPGYPQPFVSNITNGVEKITETRVGEWKISVAPNPGPCGGFDANGQRIENINRYCLLNENRTTLHSESVSSPLTGNFGLRLPNISNIILSNVAVEDSTLNENDKALFVNSHIAIHLREPLSYAQLSVYCEKDPTEIVEVPKLGDSVRLSVVGCASLLSDGSNANEKYEDNIQLMLAEFSSVSGKRKRRDTGEDETEMELDRTRRQTGSGSATIQPVVSEIVLQATELRNPPVDPRSNPSGFVALIQDSFNFTTLARVIFETLGVSIDVLIQHSMTAAPLTDPHYYYEHDNGLTPQVERVVAADPDNLDDVYGAGDTITISFDRDTDQPDVATKANLDMIFSFNPPLGNNYVGMWITPNELQITIMDSGLDEGIPPPSVDNLVISFKPNYFHTGDEVTSNNTIVPTETPWCIGINVCGRQTTNDAQPSSVGICDVDGLSCRVYQGVIGIEGSFGTGEPVSVSLFPFWWIIIAIVVVILIVILIVVIYFVYRHYKLRAQRAEAKKVVERWRKDRFAPGKEAEKKDDGPKPWVKPPDVSTMRENPDPFGALPSIVPRPATAAIEVENLPPVPSQPFKPRQPANIRASLGGGGAPLPLVVSL